MVVEHETSRFRGVGFRAVLGIGLLCGMGLGCGSPAVKPAGEQAQVVGVVKLDEKPLPVGCEVVFYNKDKGVTLGAKVDSAGKYVLAAADPKVGIPTGKYRVAVRPPAAPAVQVSGANYADMMSKGPGAVPETASPIPAKYKDYETSKFEYDLTTGKNEINIDLSTQ